ncbi:MAG: 23S rRNA (uracil(1939)-C(5))-methyltransferase RlmD, partial [Thermostichales cyanobacterium BF4_bins_65]
GECGGCQWQHLDPAAQLAWKQQQVIEAFSHPVAVPFEAIAAPIAAPSLYGYRNKMEFSFGERRWLTAAEIASGAVLGKDRALGLHVPGRFDRVLDIEECLLQPPLANQILQTLRQGLERYQPSIYQTRSHQGFLRHLVIRTAQQSRQSMAILVTSPPQSEIDRQFLAWYAQALPQVTTVVHAITTRKAQVATGEIHILQGPGYITEILAGLQFRISPWSFFQTNPEQAEQLVAAVRTAVDPKPEHILWDLYCGTGTLGLSLARHLRQVIGIELNPAAVADARLNAHLNQIDNSHFFQEDLSRTGDLWQQLPPPDCVIVDPPRAGLDTGTLQRLLALAPAKIVYVSCHPATQARDCALLSQAYRIANLQPLDMFPHTGHIENIATLIRRASP